MSNIQHNIENITQHIRDTESKCGRALDSVQLLAVSKTKPNSLIIDAINAGHQAFGENYVQEGVDKIHYFTEHYSDTRIDWHFIGPIQSNKTRPIAENFDWVHSIERKKIAKRLSDQRPSDKPALQVLIQINISQEESKSGIKQTELFELASYIESLPQLDLRGVMAIPANVPDYSEQMKTFKTLENIYLELQAKYPHIDTLSMGMSGDMEAAIAAGSTMVRVGTAIFGARDYSNKK
jgi:pyridoxal phosphate enzyme (YggS family)